MDGGHGFCPKCGTDVPFDTEIIDHTATANGKEYTYPVRIARCRNCHSMLDHPPYKELARISLMERMNEDTRRVSFGDFTIDPEEDERRLRKAKKETIALVVLCIIVTIGLVLFVPTLTESIHDVKSYSDPYRTQTPSQIR